MKEKRLILLCSLGIAVAIATVPVVKAKAQNSNIKSYGKFSYLNEDSVRVKLYSEDIRYLADEIDKLKAEIQ